MILGAGGREEREDLKVLGGHFMAAFDLFPKHPVFSICAKAPCNLKAKM